MTASPSILCGIPWFQFVIPHNLSVLTFPFNVPCCHHSLSHRLQLVNVPGSCKLHICLATLYQSIWKGPPWPEFTDQVLLNQRMATIPAKSCRAKKRSTSALAKAASDKGGRRRTVRTVYRSDIFGKQSSP